jgi:hypothetical protein
MRVSDHATLELCANELFVISQAINGELTAMIKTIFRKKKSCDNGKITIAINRLEENYYHVLQITAPDPLAFVLFINSLKMLSHEITACQLKDNG